jgi:HAD superfamily hydrolase (TIGR01509 family)
MEPGSISLWPDAKALIYDCDGTLADSMPLHIESWERAFRDFGEEYQREYLTRLKGLSEERIVEMYNRRFSRSLDPHALVARKHHYFLQKIHLIKPIEPVVNTVRENAGKLPMAVVSGAKRRMVERTLDVLKIKGLFQVILTADDPFSPKENPEIFLAAARLLGADPRFCQVFEDGDIGLESARRAGMFATDVSIAIGHGETEHL